MSLGAKYDGFCTLELSLGYGVGGGGGLTITPRSAVMINV
jgi:hypothetical protein